MNDPLGLISNKASAALGPYASMVQNRPTDGPNFKEVLQDQIAQVNALQKDAKEAVEDLVAKRRTDVEAVMLANQKADTAFQMLLQVRNKVMDAYDEVKQLRV